MAHGSAHTEGSTGAHDLGGVGQSARRLGNIIHQQHVLTSHITNDVDRIDRGRARALFPNHTELRAKNARIGGGHFHPTDIRRNNNHVIGAKVLKIFEKDGRSKEVIDRDIEETLNLLRM